MSHSDTTVNIIIKDTARRKGVFEVVDCHNSHLSQVTLNFSKFD